MNKQELNNASLLIVEDAIDDLFEKMDKLAQAGQTVNIEKLIEDTANDFGMNRQEEEYFENMVNTENE